MPSPRPLLWNLQRCSLPRSSRTPNPKYCQNQEEIFIQLYTHPDFCLPLQVFVASGPAFVCEVCWILRFKFPSVHKIQASSPAALTSGCDGRNFSGILAALFEQEKPYNQLRLVVEIPWFSTSKRWVSLRISQPSAVGPFYQDGPKIPVISVGAHVPPLISGWKKTMQTQTSLFSAIHRVFVDSIYNEFYHLVRLAILYDLTISGGLHSINPTSPPKKKPSTWRIIPGLVGC